MYCTWGVGGKLVVGLALEGTLTVYNHITLKSFRIRVKV